MKTKTRKSGKILTADGKVTPELFQRMVDEHDPVYLWSENDAHIQNERHKEAEIEKARKIIGDEAAVPIWNQAMRRKIVPSFVEEYLWKIETKTETTT
ncbi:MAG: hypothetical protein EBS90_11930 [Betaproteobacteria bacterium]|nr:hypothetical protein [Betaproteobacteria bacterium]